MTDDQYLNLGKHIINHLEKLMSGEHMGNAVIVPIKTKGGGMCRLRIEMPTNCDFWNGKAYHFIWVPESQVFVLDEYVFREKKKKKN